MLYAVFVRESDCRVTFAIPLLTPSVIVYATHALSHHDHKLVDALDHQCLKSCLSGMWDVFSPDLL